MTIVELEAADKAEALIRDRWYDIDEPSARFIVDVVSALDDIELLRRPHLIRGSVIALDLLDLGFADGGDRATLLERFARVVETGIAQKNSQADAAQWLLLSMISARWRGDLDRAVALSAQLARQRPTVGVRAALLDDDHERDRPGQIALQRGLTALLGGSASEAMELFSESYRATGPGPHRHFAAINGAANAAMLAAVEGHDAMAEKWLARVGDVTTLPAWCRDLIAIGGTIASSVLASDALDLEQSARLADSLEAVGDRFELWPFQLYALTAHDLARNEPVAAFRRFKQVGFERNVTLSKVSIADHLAFRAYLDTLIAAGEGGIVLRLTADQGTPLRSLIPLARTHLLAGDDVGASKIAAEALRRVLIPKRDMWEAAVVHAIASLRRGEKEAAAHSFALVTAGMPQMLPSILARQPARDVEDLFTMAGIEPPTFTTHSDPLPAEIIALTSRERRVLQHLVDGLTPAAIADVDVTSEQTVRTHIKRIYRKLGVRNRAAAVAVANQHGMVRWANRRRTH